MRSWRDPVRYAIGVPAVSTLEVLKGSTLRQVGRAQGAKDAQITQKGQETLGAPR